MKIELSNPSSIPDFTEEVDALMENIRVLYGDLEDPDTARADDWDTIERALVDAFTMGMMVLVRIQASAKGE